MPNYRLTIVNQSGMSQKYSFFCSPPIVTGGTAGEVWSTVLAAKNTPSGGRTSFELGTDFYAICGNSDITPQPGVQLMISKSVPITLGSLQGDSVNQGSSVKLSVQERNMPDLEPPHQPGSGKVNMFQMTTGGDFSTNDAKKSTYPHKLLTERYLS